MIIITTTIIGIIMFITIMSIIIITNVFGRVMILKLNEKVIVFFHYHALLNTFQSVRSWTNRTT